MDDVTQAKGGEVSHVVNAHGTWMLPELFIQKGHGRSYFIYYRSQWAGQREATISRLNRGRGEQEEGKCVLQHKIHRIIFKTCLITILPNSDKLGKVFSLSRTITNFPIKYNPSTQKYICLTVFAWTTYSSTFSFVFLVFTVWTNIRRLQIL